MSARLDIASLLAVLDDNGVAYVVVGSVAALAHGAPAVVPGDLDVVPATDPANLERVRAALVALAATPQVDTGQWDTDEMGEPVWVEDGIERPPRPLDPSDPETVDHSFATGHGRLDVVPRIAGPYAELRLRASRMPVDGREAWVAHPVDVLAGMTSPRRAKDVPRVRHLRQLVAARTAGVTPG